MDPSFIPIEIAPVKREYALDQLRRSYKTSLSAEDAAGAAPEPGNVDEVFPALILMSVDISESAESACRVDLGYMGMIDLSETPLMPDTKHSESDAVASATTYTSSAIFPNVATVPASVEYHAHSTSIMIFSITDTTMEICPDPPAITVDDLVTWTLAATQPASSFPDIADWLLTNAFVQRVIETISVEEVVPARYWQITKRKTMQLYPYAPP